MASLTFMSTLLLGSLTATASAAIAVAEELRDCGGAPYYPSQYTCYNNEILCPILYGQPTIPCHGACYSPDMYECVHAQLELLPEAEGPFTVAAQTSFQALHGLEVKACGNYFQVGSAAETCVYCYHAPPMYDCPSYKNRTVFTPTNGNMDVDVPGSQFWYIDPADGALRFTEGGKANNYGMQWAGENVTVYEDGYFSWHGQPHHWLACPVEDVADLYRIYAATEENLKRTDCHDMKLVTDSSDVKEGAYMYS